MEDDARAELGGEHDDDRFDVARALVSRVVVSPRPKVFVVVGAREGGSRLGIVVEP
jgi:hypothetical protein